MHSLVSSKPREVVQVANKDDFFLWSTKPVPYVFQDQTVFLKPWSARVREEFGRWCKGKEKEEATSEVICRVLVNTVCDEQGNLLFTLDDIPRLLTMPATILDDLSRECVKVNQADKASVDEAKKN